LNDLTQYAGFWRRLAASIIDSIIFLILFVLIRGALGIMNNLPMASMDLASVSLSQILWQTFSIWETLISLLLTVLMWKKFLGTPGKLFFDCIVVDEKTHQPMKVGQALVRYLSYYISIIPLGLGFIWIAFDKKKQGFHDKIAKTVVIMQHKPPVDSESEKSLAQLMKEVR